MSKLFEHTCRNVVYLHALKEKPGMMFFLHVPCHPLFSEWLLPRVNKTLWLQGGIYLHLHAILSLASLCFPLSKHESIVVPSLSSIPAFTIPSTYLTSPLCRLFVMRPLLTPLHPPTHSQGAFIFTPHSRLPHALVSPPSSLWWCHPPHSSVSLVYTGSSHRPFAPHR